ncbi:MAG: hypothetical protein ACLFWL_11615 [Candidatus Brocadiia bacterium]
MAEGMLKVVRVEWTESGENGMPPWDELEELLTREQIDSIEAAFPITKEEDGKKKIDVVVIGSVSF